MAYIDLEQAKAHLRVDFDDDDNYIESLIGLVEAVVQNEIGVELSSIESDGKLPQPLIHAMLLMLSHFYAVRESVVLGLNAVEVPYGFRFLIAPYKCWTVK